MAELRMVCDKEIEIEQQRLEKATLSLINSLQSIESAASETVSNQEKIGNLKTELRALEDGLVKAVSVKTRKEAQKMAISDSIAATKAKIEERKTFVADQRTRKDEYAEIISYQSEALKECEKKHKQDAECREEIEEAISWYNRVLGFRIERGRGIKFVFTNINLKNPNEEYFFTIRLENNNYSLLDCHPHLSEAKKLIQELNVTNGLYSFVRTMRAKFQEEVYLKLHLVLKKLLLYPCLLHSLQSPLTAEADPLQRMIALDNPTELPGNLVMSKGYNHQFCLLHLYVDPHGLR